jgi:hydroxypyruvate isomerase
MDRRTFLVTAATTAAASALTGRAAAQGQAQASSPAGKFKLKYAPGLDTFKAHVGDDPIENIKFAADQGFTAMFDNGLGGKPKDLQEKIGKEMARLGMTLGPFVMYAWGQPALVTGGKEARDALLKATQEGVEVAKRANVKWALLTAGSCVQNLEWDYQTANVIEHLKACAKVAEPAGLVVVIEPLNWWANHPGLFFQKIPQAYMICKAVGSPSVKIINDLYHQQITEGNLIPNIDRAWDEIAAFHVGDNPGRREPGTGEINYRNVFRHIHTKGYAGVLCMEHGKSKQGKEGERAVIDAYRACDDFAV